MANNQGDGGGSAVAIVAILVIVILVAVFLVWGMPALRSGTEAPSEIKVEIPNPLPTENGGGQSTGTTQY